MFLLMLAELEDNFDLIDSPENQKGNTLFSPLLSKHHHHSSSLGGNGISSSPSSSMNARRNRHNVETHETDPSAQSSKASKYAAPAEDSSNGDISSPRLVTPSAHATHAMLHYHSSHGSLPTV